MLAPSRTLKRAEGSPQKHDAYSHWGVACETVARDCSEAVCVSCRSVCTHADKTEKAGGVADPLSNLSLYQRDTEVCLKGFKHLFRLGDCM